MELHEMNGASIHQVAGLKMFALKLFSKEVVEFLFFGTFS